jgi:phenylacetate-CoA ligase
VVFHTSGTTGERLRVLHDRDSFDYHTAACVRRFLATGRYLPIYRLSHLRHFTPPKRAFERLGLFRRHVILTHRPMPEIKAALLANRPRVLIGYPVHLRELLRSLTPEELARLRRRLRLVFSESELLVPGQRRPWSRGSACRCSTSTRPTRC